MQINSFIKNYEKKKIIINEIYSSRTNQILENITPKN